MCLVIGTVFQPHQNSSEIYFETFEIRTPNKIGMTVSANGWNVHHVYNPRHIIQPTVMESTQQIRYEDLVVKSAKRVKRGFVLTISIDDSCTLE